MVENARFPGRLIFFDNLRYLFVLFVVAEHSANAYRGLDWWPVAQGDLSWPAYYLSSFSDVFAMPLLFYIAGYFALPNLLKKGTAGFIIGKLKRLGIPWLVCILTICPVMTLIYHFTRNGFQLNRSYGDLWLEVMNKALEFNVGIVSSMNQFMQANGFYQRYMWFLSLLLAFFLVFALLYVLAGRRLWPAGKTRPAKPATLKSSLILFFALSGATTLFSFASTGLMMVMVGHPEPLFNLGNLIQFRPSRFFFYLIYFILGVVTYRNQWLQRGFFSGRVKVWAVLFTILLAALLASSTLLRLAPSHLQAMIGGIYFLVINLLCAACLGLCVSLGLKYWNRPKSRDQLLAANSYDIYLSHYIFVGLGQLLLLPLAIPLSFKFLIVALFAGSLAYAASQWLIRPHPRLAAAGAFGLLLLMALLVQP